MLFPLYTHQTISFKVKTGLSSKITWQNDILTWRILKDLAFQWPFLDGQVIKIDKISVERFNQSLRGFRCRVSDFFNWYSILLIRLRWFRICFPNHSIVIRSRASILPMISGDFLSQKRETGTKCGLSIYFIYFCPGMGKDPHYLYFHGWWPYNVAQQVIFSTQVDSNNRITGK